MNYKISVRSFKLGTDCLVQTSYIWSFVYNNVFCFN